MLRNLSQAGNCRSAVIGAMPGGLPSRPAERHFLLAAGACSTRGIAFPSLPIPSSANVMRANSLLSVVVLLAAAISTLAYPAVVGPDDACRWLAAEQLGNSGWLCCQNRTLSVQDGLIVGRRRGLTGFCDELLQASTSLPRTAVQVRQGGMNVYTATF